MTVENLCLSRSTSAAAGPDLQMLFSRGQGLYARDMRRQTPNLGCRSVPSTTVLKLTRECNLACRYCYVDSDRTHKRMDVETILTTVSQMSETAANEIFLFLHGGEPLLAFDVIVEAVDRLRTIKISKPVRLCIQTNGTLIQPRHAIFFKQSDVRVGVSLDGYQEIQDQCRRYSNGKGSFAAVQRGIETLREYDVRFSVLFVVTRINVHLLSEILSFMESKGIYNLAAMPFVPKGRGQESRGELELDPVKYFEGMRQATEWLISHNQIHPRAQHVYIREIDWLTRNITQPGQGYMCMRSPCGAARDTFTVDIQGDVYPCDAFVCDPKFLMGNIHKEPLGTLLQEHAAAEFRNRTVIGLDRCRQCNWKFICGGGCPALTFYSSGTIWAQSPLCEYFMRMIPYLVGRFNQGLDPNLLTSDSAQEW